MAVPYLDREALQVYRKWCEAQSSPSPLSMRCFGELVAAVQKPLRQELEGQKKELERQKKELEKQKKEVVKLMGKMKAALGARAPRTPPLRGSADYDRPTPHGAPSIFDEPAADGLDEESMEWSVEYEDQPGDDDEGLIPEPTEPETPALRARPKKRSCSWK